MILELGLLIDYISLSVVEVQYRIGQTGPEIPVAGDNNRA
jgi:hypothetical protein